MSGQTFVVVGAGQAGGYAVKTLREEGFDGRIILLGNEAHAPYERPPLSKGVLTGKVMAPELTLFSAESLVELGVESFTNCNARRIFLDLQVVETDLGHEVHYDKLLLSTGGRPFLPPFPGSDSRDVLCLRTLDDALRIKQRLIGSLKRIVVVGAGWIGLEIAATARTLGHEVTVIEMTERVCSRSVMPEVSEQLAQLHESKGVTIRLRTQISAIEPSDNTGSVVTLATGETLLADTVILGVGLLANDELARDAGLVCNRGVLVNANCQTSDPHVFAAGDVAVIQYQNPIMQCRLESWQNAQDQGIASARAMLGQKVLYQPIPLLWSEQYDTLIQIAGHPQLAHKTVVRSIATPMSMMIFGLNTQNQVMAVVGLNAGRYYRNARKLVESSAQIDPEALSNSSVSLHDAVLTVQT